MAAAARAPHSAPSLQDVLAALNPAQREAAEAVRGPVCILAGAGSGKTRTIAHRIANQVATGVARPDQVLAVTFTDRAATELRARLRALGIPGAVRAATFHAAAWAQLRYFRPRLDEAPLPEVLASKVRMLVPAARRLGAEARDLAAEIEWAKARRLDPAGYATRAARRDGPVAPAVMAEVYAGYEREKSARNLIDYEDMLLEVIRMLAEHPQVAEAVRDRYRFLTVDEFQDVNPAQEALLRAWLGERDELCVVGDDDQTIYSFAGATSAYLTGFRRRFPGAKIVTLNENYRSTPDVLALANRVLWTKPAELRKRLVARAAHGPAPIFTEFDDAEAEVAGTVRRVRALLDGGVAAGQIAVCYRVNSQSEPFEEALRDARIPYLVRGEAGFFERREVRQALGVLRAAVDRPQALDDGVAGSRRAGPRRVDRVVEQALRDGMSWHPRKAPAGEAARERWRNLGVLVELAAEATRERPSLDAPAFVAELLARSAAGHETASADGAVTLLTLHRAKGLEFDAVLLVGLEEGLLPISHAKADDEIEEERRLLYVGVTRARRHLSLSWARSRPSLRGRPMARRPSRFLYGLGPGAPQKTPARRPVAAPAAGDADPELVERLRAWRRDRAQRDGVPAYVVFADRTLAELAATMGAGRPLTPADLLAVHGLGPAKVDRYADDLLALVAGGDAQGRDRV